MGDDMRSELLILSECYAKWVAVEGLYEVVLLHFAAGTTKSERVGSTAQRIVAIQSLCTAPPCAPFLSFWRRGVAGPPIENHHHCTVCAFKGASLNSNEYDLSSNYGRN